MEELEEKSLIECLIFLGRGQSPSYVDDDSGVYAINQKCIRNGAVDTCFSRPHNQQIKAKDSAHLQDGDVCINSTGTGTIGRVGLWSSKGHHDGAVFFADSHVTIARPCTETVNPKYLAAMLESAPMQTAMETFCFSGSTNQVELNRTALEKLKIGILGREAQNRVAAILSTLDQAIGQTEKIIAKQQLVKIGLMQDLLTKGVDKNGVIRSEATHEFMDSRLGRIPVEWQVSELREKASVKGGKRLPQGHAYSESDTGFRYLQTTDFIKKQINYSAMHYLHPKTFNFLERYEILSGDIFISIAGVNLGVAGVFNPNISDRTILTENAAKIKLLNDDVPDFVATQLNGPIIQSQINSDKGIGAGVPKLALFRIETFLMPWPNKDEQLRILRLMSASEKMLSQQMTLLSKYIHLKTGLMHDLLTGKVRVKY